MNPVVFKSNGLELEIKNESLTLEMVQSLVDGYVEIHKLND